MSEQAKTAADLAVEKLLGPLSPTVSGDSMLGYIIANIPHSIFWKDVEGRFLGANHNFLRDAGMSTLDQLIGKTDYEIGVSREQADLFCQSDQEVLAAGSAVLDIEALHDQTDGTHTLLTSKVPLRDGEGRVIGLLGIYVDITERKRMEQALRSAYETLDCQHRELLTAHEQIRDTQAQLVHSAKIAALGTIVGGLCHELNNPLSVILMNTQGLLARTSTADGASRRALGRIERHTRRCAQLVDNLLEVSRKKDPVRERLAARSLLDRLAELLQSCAGRAELRLMTPDALEALPEVMVCVQDLETVLLNLLSNALDASPPGESVELSARTRERHGQRGLELAVGDRGGGIPAKVLPHIFEPFFTTKPAGRGTGLGLPISRKIIEDHGGTLDVETGADGTTVRSWLPPIHQGES